MLMALLTLCHNLKFGSDPDGAYFYYTHMLVYANWCDLGVDSPSVSHQLLVQSHIAGEYRPSSIIVPDLLLLCFKCLHDINEFTFELRNILVFPSGRNLRYGNKLTQAINKKILFHYKYIII